MPDPTWLREGVKPGSAATRCAFPAAADLVLARERAGLSQAQCARRMQTTQSAVARLESGRQSPSLRSLRRYAAAVGCDLELRLVPAQAKPAS